MNEQTAPIAELLRYILRLGLLGFGGPAALVGQMERELVAEESRKVWSQGVDRGTGSRCRSSGGRTWWNIINNARSYTALTTPPMSRGHPKTESVRR
jgi:hypothetical protein